MNNYWFFLSHANDANGYPQLQSFYEDLAGGPSNGSARRKFSHSEIGFLDQSDIQNGDQWLQTLTEAIQTSRTFVCNIFPRLFQ